ncbi:hypothetical protein Golomagni_06212 [Golovinomyces magnicellulatus]|nr:hypothetical protein Golomagni_06212 [Golovinomyces magnicellulatus]
MSLDQLPDDHFRPTYEEIHVQIGEAARRIKGEFDPDLMVAIGGGGFYPARVLPVCAGPEQDAQHPHPGDRPEPVRGGVGYGRGADRQRGGAHAVARRQDRHGPQGPRQDRGGQGCGWTAGQECADRRRGGRLAHDAAVRLLGAAQGRQERHRQPVGRGACEPGTHSLRHLCGAQQGEGGRQARHASHPAQAAGQGRGQDRGGRQRGCALLLDAGPWRRVDLLPVGGGGHCGAQPSGCACQEARCEPAQLNHQNFLPCRRPCISSRLV